MNESKYEKGDNVMYISNSGEIEIGQVINVHYDDNPPYYTIKLIRKNIEKVTDEKNLTILEKENEEEEENNVNNDVNNNDINNKNDDNKNENKVQDKISKKTRNNNSLFSLEWISISVLLSLGLLVSYKYLRNLKSTFS